MRKLTLLLLLATAAAPAIAQDRGGRQHRSDSAQQSENASQRETRVSQRESRRTEAPRGGQRSERSAGDQAGMIERVREHRQQRIETAASPSTQSSGGDQVRLRRGGDDGARVRRVSDSGATAGQPSTNWRERERRVRTIPDTQPSARRSVQVEREGLQTRSRRDYRNGDYTRWSDSWRRDRRYDWRRYRDQNRSVFRLGFYYDPFGWNYRRWSIGSYLNAGYYRSSYWLNDPWRYRLPPAYGPYRWVRYWNDALLVNIYTGEVVDVMQGFFW